MIKLTKQDKMLIINSLSLRYGKYWNTYLREKERLEIGTSKIDTYNANFLVKLGIRKRKSHIELQFIASSMDMHKVMAEEIKKVLNKVKKWKTILRDKD